MALWAHRGRHIWVYPAVRPSYQYQQNLSAYHRLIFSSMTSSCVPYLHFCSGVLRSSMVFCFIAISTLAGLCHLSVISWSSISPQRTPAQCHFLAAWGCGCLTAHHRLTFIPLTYGALSHVEPLAISNRHVLCLCGNWSRLVCPRSVLVLCLVKCVSRVVLCVLSLRFVLLSLFVLSAPSQQGYIRQEFPFSLYGPPLDG